MELHALTIAQAREMLARKEISSVELTQAVLTRIAALDPLIQAYLSVTADQALDAARAADAAIAQGDAAPLTGIPVALKDVLCTAGVRTTCGSRILENFVPPYDAFVVQRLKSQKGRPAGQAQHG